MFVAVAVSTWGSPAGSIQSAAVEEPFQPNIVLILTDDQRFDTLKWMPKVRKLLAGPGIKFDLGYVVDPLCCPSRASTLTGTYPHTHMVYSNLSYKEYGGFPAFEDEDTIATRLQAAGYRTGLFGKYLNGYESTYVPPGWDRWFATYNNGGFYNYDVTSDGQFVHFGDDPADYGMTVIRHQVVDFIRSTDDTTPLFAYVAPHAPHAPATAAPGDEELFDSLEPLRPENFDEADVSDKPAYIAGLEPLKPGEEKAVDKFREDQLRSLQAVDAAVARIVEALRDTGRLHDTMVVFTSDNGMLWGEHRWRGKSVPYEEAIRVPLVVRFDAGELTTKADDAHLMLNIDLAPTFAELAGASIDLMEGHSMLPLLADASAPWRSSFLVEVYKDRVQSAPTLCAAHTRRWVFVEYETGETELYDLRHDPLQLRNVSGKAAYAHRQELMVAKIHKLCSPPPPGLTLVE
ncbi:MAG TPA: sulfatase [Actinomycetota bacterium]